MKNNNDGKVFAATVGMLALAAFIVFTADSAHDIEHAGLVLIMTAFASFCYSMAR